MKKSLFLPLLLAAGLAVESAQADLLAVDPTSVDFLVTAGTDSYTYGYNFTVAPGISYQVTALGVFDHQFFGGGDGLDQAHDVGLWSGDGSTLLASLTVPSGTGGTLVASGLKNSGGRPLGGWRFVDLLTPVVLTPASYLIGAFYAANSDDRIAPVGNASSAITTLSGITVGDGQRVLGASLAAPTEFSISRSFGPSFQVAQVPEPATLALFGLGLAGLRAARRKRTAA